MKWGRLAALAIGGATLVAILASTGLGTVAGDVGRAGYALPVALAIHAVQLILSGYAWRAAIGPSRLRTGFILRVRWIREGVNTMLPTAQIGGPVVGAGLLARAGLAPALAVAGTILD